MKALFLDRDGIINIDHSYVYKIEDFEFVEGIFDLVKRFADNGYLIFIITNQSGIGRGYYTEESFTTLTQWMIERFIQEGIHVEKVYYCPHSPETKCHCRKPETGMIDEAMKSYDIDLSRSWMIGDKQSDIDLAKNTDIGKSIYIGDKSVNNAIYSFKTILECKQYYLDHGELIND